MVPAKMHAEGFKTADKPMGDVTDVTSIIYTVYSVKLFERAVLEKSCRQQHTGGPVTNRCVLNGLH